MNWQAFLEDEASTAVEGGERFPARYERTGFQRNFAFNAEWRGKHHGTKQHEVHAVHEGEDWLVITVIARYF